MSVHNITTLHANANSECSDEPVHPRSLIRASDTRTYKDVSLLFCFLITSISTYSIVSVFELNVFYIKSIKTLLSLELRVFKKKLVVFVF